MSDEEIKRLKEITGGLDYIIDFHFPRFVGNGPTQLLCFCDASNKAYATAIYLRKITGGNVNVNLLFSNARNIIPNTYHTKAQTLPILIGVRGLLFVTKALKIEVTERIL